MESIYEEPSQVLDDDGGSCNLLASDSNASLLIVTHAGTIRVRDIRKELLSGEWLRGAGKLEENDGQKVVETRTLRPQPELGVRPRQLSASHDGAYAAVAGTSTEESDQAAVAVLDLTFRRPAPRDGTGAERCECAHVDSEHFRSRPGLRVLQMAWHPGSSTHLAVLTSDNTWQLYHAANLSHPEQRFELRLDRRKGVGMDGGKGRRAVAFAFGPQHSWQRFTVFFLCSDGAMFALCPVAPFGAGMPASAVQALLQVAADSDDDLAHSATTNAWLQQALSGQAAQGGVVAVQRHALDEHVPALSGPLVVACSEGAVGSFLDWAQEDDEAVSLCAVWFGGAATVLLAASGSGLLGAHLLAEDILPAWAESAPLCLTDDTHLLSVRSEVPLLNEAGPSLLLLDLIDLQVLPATSAADGDATGHAALHLLPDEAAPELLYVRSQTASWAVTLSWLPALANFLAEDREGLEEVAQLPPPRIEELYSSERGNPIAGACVAGDALTGTAIVLLTADGRHHCLGPSSSPAADQAPWEGRADGAGAQELESQVEQLYGALLRGPQGQKRPLEDGLGLAVSSPEGTRAVGEGIRSLLERHVEFIHQAHHHLLPRVKELKEAGEAQLHHLERLTDLHGAVQQSQTALVGRLDRAAKLHSNLHSRVKLLAELHYQLPRPLSAAEARMRDIVLPDAEASVEDLQLSVQGAQRRWVALKAKGQEEAAAPAAAAAPLSVPAPQLRRIRAALAEQAVLTASAIRGLAAMESWVHT